MKTLKGVEVGLGKDNIQVLLEGMISAVVLGQEQVWEPVLTEIGLNVLNVGHMIILLRTMQIHKQKKSQNRYNKCMI